MVLQVTGYCRLQGTAGYRVLQYNVPYSTSQYTAILRSNPLPHNTPPITPPHPVPSNTPQYHTVVNLYKGRGLKKGFRERIGRGNSRKQEEGYIGRTRIYIPLQEFLKKWQFPMFRSIEVLTNSTLIHRR